MNVYSGWTYSKGEPVPGSRNEFFHKIEDDSGNSWYDLMWTLDEPGPTRWVVGISPEGYVGWIVNGPVAEGHVPVPGGSVVVCPAIPAKMAESFMYWKFDGKCFVYAKPAPQPERTKDDIMADLLRLQAELANMKGG